MGLAFPQEGTSFGILATGLVASADDPDTNNSETLGGLRLLATTFRAELVGLNNAQGNDLVELTLVLTAPVASDCLLFRFAFFSEEFPDFVGRQFNDTFTAFLNGSNIAFDTNGNPIDVNTNFGFNPANPNPNTGTTYDGTTGLLEAAGPVVGGSTNTLVSAGSKISATRSSTPRSSSTSSGSSSPAASVRRERSRSIPR